MFILKLTRLDHRPGSSMGLLNYIMFQTIAQLSTYHVDQSSLISGRQPTNYLAQLLKPLSELQYTIKNSKTFTKRLKKIRIPRKYKMVSFDVVSLFTKVPLDETIDIIIKRIYDKKEINTDIPKKEMRELL